jgi:hypothetical protein
MTGQSGYKFEWKQKKLFFALNQIAQAVGFDPFVDFVREGHQGVLAIVPVIAQGERFGCTKGAIIIL